VPMMEMIKSTELELAPPRILESHVAHHRRERRMGNDHQRNDDEVDGDEEHHEALPASKRPDAVTENSKTTATGTEM